MTTGRETSGLVAFTGDWDTQVVATSVHAGHDLRPEIAAAMVLDEDVRLREEDPHTDVIAAAVDSRALIGPLALRGRSQPPPRRGGLPRPGRLLGPRRVGRRHALRRPDRRSASPCTTSSTSASASGSTRWPPAVPSCSSTCTPTTTVATAPTPTRSPPRTTRWSTSGPAPSTATASVAVVDDFMETLSRQHVGGEPLDVRENVKFQGARLSWFVHDRYPGVGCCPGARVQEDLHGRVDRRGRPRAASRRPAGPRRHRPGARAGPGPAPVTRTPG